MGQQSRQLKVKQMKDSRQEPTTKIPLGEPGHASKIRFIRKPEVLARTGLSNSALYLKISQNIFPAPIHPYGPRVAIWLESEIDQFLSDQLVVAGKEAQI